MSQIVHDAIQLPTRDVAKPTPSPAMFTRDLIPNDRELEPYLLTGVRRTTFAVIYVALIVLAFGGAGYCVYVNPLFGIFGIVSAYLCNNIAFAITHVRFHTSFIEVPEEKMDVLVHHSLIHHYRDVQIFHKTWLETRMSYFIDPKFGVLSIVFLSMIPGNLIISAFLYQVNPLLGISYVCTIWVAEMLQSTVHEWYHNPTPNRRSFYNPVLYGLFTLLEKTGIASTKDHTRHHRHRLHNLNDVEKWMDLFLPFGEMMATAIWDRALVRYEPGKTKMTDYVNKVINVSYVLLHAGLIGSYLLINHFFLR